MSLRHVLPDGGNWEGGETDHLGRRWQHEPWVGWRLAAPAFTQPPPRRRRWRRRNRKAPVLRRRAG